MDESAVDQSAMRERPGRRAIGCLALCATALATQMCAAPPAHQRAWVEVGAPHFVLLSHTSQAEALEISAGLERFHRIVEVVTGRRFPPSSLPLRVFVLDGSSYRESSPGDALGYLAPTARGCTIVVSGGNVWVRSREILQHEYVHFLLRNDGRHAYPPWYDEGFAEFLSNVDERRGVIDIGRPVRGRIKSLPNVGWIPVSALVATRSRQDQLPSQVGAFYAEAWALVHYLHFGRDVSRAPAEMSRYLEALRDGASDAEAVQSAFGVEVSTLGRQLREYIQAGHYPYMSVGAEGFASDAALDPRSPGAAEIALVLGDLASAVGRWERAALRYEAALAERPGDARALAGLGRALAHLGRGREAEARFAEALAAGASDPYVQLDFANHLHDRAKSARDAGEREALALQARHHYVASWKLDDSIPETFAGYGATFLLEGEDASRGRETLEAAERMLPSSPEIKLELARLYAALGRRDEARTLALIAATWGHDEETSEEIRVLLEELEDGAT